MRALPLLRIGTFVIGLCLIAAAIALLFQGTYFGMSFDLAIASEASQARLENAERMEIAPDRIINLYNYAVGLRYKLESIYINLAIISFIGGIIVLALSIYRRASKDKTEQSGAANPCPFGTSVMPPADAGATPEASRDR